MTISPQKFHLSRSKDVIIDTTKVYLWNETQEVLKAVESKLQTSLITLYVRVGSSLTSEEVGEIYKHLSFIGFQEKITLLIAGPGGYPIAATRIVKLIRKFCKHLEIICPSESQSALTLLALGGDKIIVGPLTVFSPTDTSVANHPLSPKDEKGNRVSVENFQLKKYLELVEIDKYTDIKDFRMTPYHTLSDKIHPIFLGSIQRSLSLSKMLMRDVLTTHFKNTNTIDNIVDRLNDDFPSHSYPIMPEFLQELGLNIEEMEPEINQLTLDFLNLAESFTRDIVELNGDQKKSTRRPVLIESTELRSYNSQTKVEKLANNVWSQISSTGGYMRAAVTKTKRGYYETRILNDAQFRKFLGSETVEVE